MNASGTRKCFNCGASDHLRDRYPRLIRSTTDIAGRSAKVSRVNAVDDRKAISQPTATRACSQRVTNDLHTSATRGVRGAGSRRVMSDRVFHAVTAARDHADTAACRPSSGDHDSATCNSTESSQILRPNYWFRQKICGP